MRPGFNKDSGPDQVTKIARACGRLGLEFQRLSPFSVVCVAPLRHFGADEAAIVPLLGFTPSRAAWNAFLRTIKERATDKRADFFLGPDSCHVAFKFDDQLDFG